MASQEEINNAIMFILQNTEEMTIDSLEHISFSVWCELQDRGFEEEGV